MTRRAHHSGQLFALVLLLVCLVVRADKHSANLLPVRQLTTTLSVNTTDTTATNSTNTTNFSAPEKSGISGEEKAYVKLDFWVFDDIDLASLPAPGLGVFQALSCLTDLFLASVLQSRDQQALRLSLELYSWTYDVTKESPLSIAFLVQAYHDDQPVDPVEIVTAVETADFGDYIYNYVWKTYPIGAAETEVLREVNRISYYSQVVEPTAQDLVARLYDTLACPALSLVASTWQLGFFEDVFIDHPAPIDISALACQMFTFMTEQLWVHSNGSAAKIEVTLQSLQWKYFAPDPNGYALNVTADITGVVHHANGDKSPVPSAVIKQILAQANLLDFIQSYVHKTDSPANRIWNHVQRTRVETNIQDIVVGADVGWTSTNVCPAVTPLTTAPTTPSRLATLTPLTTPRPTWTPIITPRPTPAVGGVDQRTPAPTPLQLLPVERPPQNSPITPAPRPQPQSQPEPPAAASEPATTTTDGADPDFMEWCRRALYNADEDGNKRLNATEYVHLINLVGDSAYEGYPFVALPRPLKTNFEAWASEETGWQLELDAPMILSKREAEVNGVVEMPKAPPADEQHQQQIYRDAVCQATNAALTQAASENNPAPVRLRIATEFMVYNTQGVQTKEDFWAHSEEIAPTFADFVTSYVAARLGVLLSGSSRQLLRSRSLAQTQYWVLPDSSTVFQVKDTACPQGVPSNAHCFQPSVKYEIFVLTPTPNDSSDTDAVQAAAQQATIEGIANGNLQLALDNRNVNSVWKLQVTSDTPAPTLALPTTSPPSTDQNPIDVVYIDDDALDGVLVRGNGTKVASDVQCGGDLGMKALNMTGTDCNSFAGRYFWHIVVIAGLVVFLCVAFLPLVIWGRYPCCCSNQPQSMARLVGNRNKTRDEQSARLNHYESHDLGQYT